MDGVLTAIVREEGWWRLATHRRGVNTHFPWKMATASKEFTFISEVHTH